MPRGGATRVTFRVGGLTSELEARAPRRRDDSSWGALAKRDLQRYYHLLEDGLRELAALHLSESDALDLANAVQSSQLDPVDAVALLLGPGELSPLGNLALADAFERYWLDPSRPILDLLAPSPPRIVSRAPTPDGPVRPPPTRS